MITTWFRKKTPIAELVPDRIQSVKGVVRCESLIGVPYSGTMCVCYSLMEERYGHGERGRGRPLWFPERHEIKCVEFSVLDDTGEVLVRETGENLRITGCHSEAGMVRNSRKRRFFAEFLRPGDTVIVRGEVTRTAQGTSVLGPMSKAPLEVIVTRRSS